MMNWNEEKRKDTKWNVKLDYAGVWTMWCERSKAHCVENGMLLLLTGLESCDDVSAFQPTSHLCHRCSSHFFFIVLLALCYRCCGTMSIFLRNFPLCSHSIRWHFYKYLCFHRKNFSSFVLRTKKKNTLVIIFESVFTFISFSIYLFAFCLDFLHLYGCVCCLVCFYAMKIFSLQFR